MYAQSRNLVLILIRVVTFVLKIKCISCQRQQQKLYKSLITLQSSFHQRNTIITTTLSTQNFLFLFKVLYIHFFTILDLLPLLAFVNPRNRLNYNDDYHVQHYIHTSVVRSSSNTLFVFSWKTSTMKRLRQVFFSHLPLLLT